MLTDRYHRNHTYLRISLTDACNFRCFYCMPDEEVDVTPHSRLMTADEIMAIATRFVQLGVNKIRLTGGEPLVRKDIAEIITRLSVLPVKLTMTTNGVMVDRYMDVMLKAGLRSINVSLDTLNVDTFRVLTKRDQFQRVRDNILLLVENGFSVKVNVVALKGVNDHEINDFIAWTKNEPLHIRFIEFMPFQDNHWHHRKVITYQEILARIGQDYSYFKLQDDVNDTCKKFQVLQHAGTFAVISTMTEPFCATCNRLRLTADGKLKNCLFSKTETDLLTLLRRNEDLLPAIQASLQQKEKVLGGQLLPDFQLIDAEAVENRSMISIGG